MLSDAIAAEDWPRALAVPLEMWRASRSPALADRIDVARLPALCPEREEREIATWREGCASVLAGLRALPRLHRAVLRIGAESVAENREALDEVVRVVPQLVIEA